MNEMVEKMGKQFNLYFKASGRARRSIEAPWIPVNCYVAFDDADDHQPVVVSFLSDHLNLDLELMRKRHSDHFHDPVNVAHAIALYHYFRNQSFFFKPGPWRQISADDAPSRDPEVVGENFALWVDFVS